MASDYLATLPDELRQQAVQTLFDPQDGGMTWARVPIGASDFARDAYSLAEQADDFDLEHFSLERDEQGMMRFIKDAQQWQPDLQIHASPWSPPGWLKTNGSMLRGGRLIDTPDHYRCYAHYFRRFVDGYAEHGIPISRICQQNEQDVATPYPSCELRPDQLVPWTVEYLAPAMAGSNCEIWGGTFRMVCSLDSHECLRSEAFRSAIAGAGFQYSFCDNMRDLRWHYPDLPIMHTESVCHEGANSWNQAAKLFEDIIAYYNAGCTLYTYWNMVLDQFAFSSWYWRQNSLITVDTETQTIRENPDLAVMKLFARHIVPGSKRIEAFSFQRPCLAIQKPCGQIVLFIANHSDQAMTLRLNSETGLERHELAPHSMNAIEV